VPNDRLTDIPSSDDVWANSGRAFISRGRGEEPRSSGGESRYAISKKRTEEPKDTKKKTKASKLDWDSVTGGKGKKKPKVKESTTVQVSKKDMEKPLSTMDDWSEENANQFAEDSRYADTIAADEKGISEEEMLGLFPGVEHKGPSDFASDLAQAFAGAGIVRGVGKLAGKAAKALKKTPAEKPLTKDTLDLDLESLKSSPDKQQKLFDYVKKQADEAGGKESLTVQGGEVLPSNRGKIQRLFFKESGEAPAKSGAMTREGAESLGSKANYNRALERLNKQLLKGEGASEPSIKTQLQNMGFSEKEIAEILKNRGG
jgi:hypothetical protein